MGEQRGVVRRAGDGERLVDEHAPRREILAEDQLGREVRQQVRARGRAGGRRRGDGCSQRLDPVIVDHAVVAPEPAVVREGRVHEHRVVTGIARDRRGAQQRLPVCRPAGVLLCGSESDEHPTEGARVRAAELDELTRLLEPGHRVIEGELLQRARAGSAGEVRGPVSVPGPDAARVVVSELAEVRVQLLRVHVADRIRDGLVEVRAASGAELVVERGAHERMGEGVLAGRGLVEDASVDGLVECPQEVCARELVDGFEHGQLEREADDRRRLEHDVRGG